MNFHRIEVTSNCPQNRAKYDHKVRPHSAAMKKQVSQILDVLLKKQTAGLQVQRMRDRQAGLVTFG